MRTLVIALFLSLLLQVARGQHRELDSLYQVLQNHPQEDTNRVLILFKVCYAELSIAPEKILPQAEEMLRISEKLKFGKGIGGAYRYMSDYYWVISDYARATEYSYKMLHAYEAAGYEKGIGRAYQALARISVYSGGAAKKSILLYEQALEHFEKANSKLDIAFLYNGLGGLYLEEVQYEKALEYFLKSLEIQKEIGTQEGLLQAYANLGQTYKHLKKYPLAVSYLDQALAIGLKNNHHHHLAQIYSYMGELYTATADYRQAETYLFKALDEVRIFGDNSVLNMIYTNLSDLEQARKQYKAQAEYLEIRAQIRDSLYNEQRTKQMAEFDTRFEVEKKNQTIELLERDQQINTLWINILIASIVLVVMISIAIYILQRYRERKDRQILNLEIDSLIAQQAEMSERHRRILAAGAEMPGDSVDQDLLKRVIRVIEENIDNPSFGVEELAGLTHMSRTSLHRKIKAITNFPPSELIRTIRLRKAAELLLRQVNNVSQVGFMVGFDDQSYFSRSFKKQFGVTPSEYAKSPTKTF